ncbi:MAG: TetR/AcrR family transcriptional regulator [Bacteroidota bacterium]
MSSTRDNIIQLAEGLIRSRGYHGFSYADIAMPLGIRNAAVHYHFPTKEELGLAVIERNRTGFAQNQVDWETMNPGEKLAAFVRMYESNQENQLLCFMGALGAGYDGLPANMQEAMRLASKEILTALAHILESGRAQGYFSFSDSSQAMADMIAGALLASLILSKVQFRNAVASVRGSIFHSLQFTSS